VRKDKVTMHLEKEQSEGLRKLSARTKTPQAVYVREAIDLLLRKYDTADDGAKTDP
jgi:predicted DNA-binding protein